MERVKLYLADDHQILIDGLVSFFRETGRIDVVGTANDGVKLLQEVNLLQPDMILLDLNMPRLDGVKTLEHLVSEYPRIKVIVLSNYHQSHLIHEIQTMGAHGYLLKNGSKQELLEAIEAVGQGKTYFKVQEKLPDEPDGLFNDEFLKKHQLTRREIEIIRLICQGLNSVEISQKLFISDFTVKTHRKNILRKLGVKNVAGLMNFAAQQGIS